MVKKPRRIRTFARTATKTQEKTLIDNAKKIYENPLLILPKATNDECQKYLSKLEKRILKIHRFKDNPEKLEKSANKKGIEAAIAGTLLLAHSEKAPYLGVVKLPTGEITFAQRGKADKEKLIGVQHHTDPILRPLAIKDLAFKRKLYLYSWEEGYKCTGTTPKPPSEFLEFITKKLTLSRKNNVLYCPHLRPQDIINQKIQHKYYLWINWKSANWYIGICQDCAKTTKNTMFTISKYMIAPDLSNDFSIKIIAEVIKHHDTKDKETQFISDYLAGQITDEEFITKNIIARKKKVGDTETRILVVNGISYGDDIEGFITALKPAQYEISVLRYILENTDEPVILEQASSRKLLEKYWPQHGKTFLSTILDEESRIESFYHLDETPSDILKFLYEYLERQEILAQYPQYTSLPPLALYIDSIVKTYLTFGKEKTLTKLRKPPDTPKAKTVTYAFLLYFKKEKDFKWKYTPEEIESGEFLLSYIKKLIESSPKKYTQNLQQLLVACGSNEQVK